MALTGSISRNNITPVGSEFDIVFNLSCQSSAGPITIFEFIRNGIVVSSNTISATSNYSNNNFVYRETVIGTHNYKVKFSSLGGAFVEEEIDISLDNIIPVISVFSLIDTQKTLSGDLELEFHIEIQDTIGIERYQIKDLHDNSIETFTPLISSNTLQEEYIKQISGGYTGTRTFELTAWDYAGNQSTVTPTSFTISSIPPSVDSVVVTNTRSVLDTYELDVQITGNTVVGQNIEMFSLRANDSTPDWQIVGTPQSGPYVLNETLTLGNTALAGDHTIYAHIQDFSANEGSNSTLYRLDKTPPEGTISLQDIYKSGTDYYGNVVMRATDGEAVASYAWAFDNPNPTPFIPITYTQDFNLTIPNVLIGPSGTKAIYAKFTDSSGNVNTKEISEYIEIDTTVPTIEFELLNTEKVANNYNFTFQLSARDNKNIIFEKLFGENLATSNTVGNINWASIPPTQIINEERTLTVPDTEAEGVLRFTWEVKDDFGNESANSSISIDFDKTIPIISSLDYKNIEKGSAFYRIFANLSAIDSVGVTAYRADFDDVANATWQTITANTHIDEEIYLDFPVTEFGNTKNFVVEVQDYLKNISANVSFDVAPNMSIPIGNASISSGSFTATDFVINFQLDAQKPAGDGDVYWYSILTDDATIRDWKALTTPNNVISEIQSIEISRVNSGKSDFYIYFADRWMNESPVTHVEYDLDAVSVSGKIEVEEITFDGVNYTANLYLEAFDNKTVNEYVFNGANTAITPIRDFREYKLINLGSTPGIRTYTVIYKDGFDNASPPYSVSFDLETVAPNVSINYVSTHYNGTDYEMSVQLITDDDTELKDYKLWYGTEPSTWTNFPPNQSIRQVDQTFTVPFADTTPNFEAKVRDLFSNENSNSLSKLITTTPPPAPTLTVNTSNYTASGTNLSIDYDVTAAIGSFIRRLVVHPFGGTLFSIPCGDNITTANGTFDYTFPLSYTQGEFDVFAESDYGYSSVTPSNIVEVFDANPPANVVIQHVASYNNGSNYIVEVNVEADDQESGIVQVNLRPQFKTTPELYPVPKTSNLDDVFSIVIPSSFSDYNSLLDLFVTVEDLLGNQSIAQALYGIQIDTSNPVVNNIVFNSGTTYSSLIEGANTTTATISFQAYDFTNITHYKYSKSADKTFDSSWTPILTTTSVIAPLDTIDLTSLGIADGLNTLYIHVRDSHGNISSPSIQFELDSTSPTINLTYNNRIERVTRAGVDTFSIPYDALYLDNYSGIESRNAWQEDANGTVYNYTTQAVTPISNNYSNVHTQEITASNLGWITFKENVTDRFYNQSANSEFSVFLKTNIPNIIDFSLVGGAQYTNTEHIFLNLDVARVQMSSDDNVLLTNYMFSASNNEIWSSTGWQNFGMGPTTLDNQTRPVDLLALGFTPGTCNVYSYVKDACQNVANSSISIIYDPDPPIVNEFRVNNVSRGFNTYDIELIANTVDSISGVDQFVISQSAIDTNFANVAGNPVVGTDVILNEIEQVPLSDYGMKYFYFKAKDAAGNVSEANTSFYIDGVLPLAASFTATSSYSNYYLSSARNQFSFIISDNNALLDVRYELQGSTHSITSYDPNLSVVSDSNTFNADFSTLSEGIYRIYLEIEDTFENVSRIPYEFYFDNDPPTISNFSVKEIRPNPAPGATANSYTVEFAISANDAVRVNEYKLFENGNLIETIPMSAVSFTATPTITTEVNSDSETKTFELKVYDLAGNETVDTITQNMSNGSSLSIDSFAVTGSSSVDVTFDYAATGVVNLSEFSTTTNSTLDYDSGFWEPIIGAPSNSVTKTNIVRLLGDINLQPVSTQNLYLHIKDECGNQVSDFVSFSTSLDVPLISSLIGPSASLKKQGNYYVGDVTFTAAGANNVVGYSIGMQPDSNLFKSISPMIPGASMTQQFKIPTSDLNGSDVLYIRLLDESGQKSPNYRISVEAVEHKMYKFEVCAPEHMASTTNQIDVLFDTLTDPYKIMYAYQFDSSTRPPDGNFILANPTSNSIGEYEFNFNVDVSIMGASDHKLWVWLKTTQDEYSFREHDFRSEPNNTPPTASLSVIKAHVYQGKKIVYVEMQVTDLGVGVSEVSIIESGTHTFKTIPTTNFKKHIEIFEYALSDTSIITYSGIAKDAAGNQSLSASTTMNLGSII